MGKARVFFEATLLNTDENHTDCILWPFARDKGNGEGRINNLGHEGPADVSIGTARLMCIRKWGNPPMDRPFAIHSCGKGHLACINPYHIRWGSVQDNSDDAVHHGTMPSGIKNHMVKLTQQQCDKIYSLKDRHSQLSVAIAYKTSQATVSLIWSRKHWSSK